MPDRDCSKCVHEYVCWLKPLVRENNGDEAHLAKMCNGFMGYDKLASDDEFEARKEPQQ